MSQKKRFRRRCDRPACGKLYRYSNPRSRTCSESCRQRLYQERKKAAAQVEQEQVEAERLEEAQARVARMKARTQADTNATRASQPAPPAQTPAPPAQTPAPTPWPYTHISRPEPPPQVVTIRYRKPYTTPI